MERRKAFPEAARKPGQFVVKARKGLSRGSAGFSVSGADDFARNSPCPFCGQLRVATDDLPVDDQASVCQYEVMEIHPTDQGGRMTVRPVERETEMAALAMATTVENATPLELKTWHFDSRSGGAGHEIRLRVAQKDGSLYLTCSCPAGRFAWAGDATGRGCWAMKRVRSILHLA